MSSVNKYQLSSQSKLPPVAIIIGGGPAGLTAAYELLKHTKIKPIVLEMTKDLGGISKTVNYKGNRIDIGGHRFFSKSKIIMDWWQNIMPLQGSPAIDDIEEKKIIPLSKSPNAPDPQKKDNVMLFRHRLSRILFLRRLFNYPISLNLDTIQKLGIVRLIKIGVSYIFIKIFPKKSEQSLEDFFINRFGNTLYKLFFKHYTEKVWGVPCKEINAEWGKQRIKGLSIRKVISHALKNIFTKQKKDIYQKNVETSLIDNFLYPKFGPGQMWEEVAKIILKKGGEIYFNQEVISIQKDKNVIKSVTTVDKSNKKSQKENTYFGKYFFSTMPIKNLIASMSNVPSEVNKVASGLCYRDFITVGILAKKFSTKFTSSSNNIKDNWIYIQERDVKVGRLQIFNNWSPYMIKNRKTIWLGLEYFTNVGDDLWSQSDKDLQKLAIEEMLKLNILDRNDVLDTTIIRVPKAYPSYFGTYDKIDELKKYTNNITNLFLIGRNGMHKYNNQDHSMLSAIESVQNIVKNVKTKDNIWQVNVEQEYHESSKKN